MHTFDDAIDLAGTWWLPGGQEQAKPGQLKFDRQGGVELNLIQSFSTPFGEFRITDASPRYPMIHGITVKGQAVSLLDTQQLGVSFNFGSGGGTNPQRIHARTLILGSHLRLDAHYISLSFNVPGLEVWLGSPAVSYTNILGENGGLSGMSYELDVPQARRFRINSINANISFHYGFGSNAEPYKSINVNVYGGFTLVPDVPQCIEWFIENQSIVISMITFLAGHPMLPNAISAKLIESTRHDLEVLYRMPASPTLKYHSPRDFFLSPTTISTELEQYTNNWFELNLRAQKPIQLARSILSSENLWLHIEFLSLMQALEGLHRALYSGNYMPDEDYQAIRQSLTQAIPVNVEQAHRDALRSRIKYGNQLSLRNRLKNLIRALPEEIKVIVCGEHDGIPSSWIDTRNYYTHWDDELALNILSDQGMYNANVRMRHLLRVLYAQLMGVSASDIEAAFNGSSNTAQQLVQLNTMEKNASDPNFQSQPLMTISEEANAQSEGTEFVTLSSTEPGKWYFRFIQIIKSYFAKLFPP